VINDTWQATFDQLEHFTVELEKVKSYVALVQIKPVWRILKSVQLKYLPDLGGDVRARLDRMVERLEIQGVSATSFTEHEVESLLLRFKESCGIDPDQFESDTDS